MQHSMQGVFVFVLLGLFAVMSTLMVLLGAQMYRGTVDRAAGSNDYRVLSAYVRSMVRAQDGAGAVGVERFGDVTALKLTEDIDGDEYVTWIYRYEGSLCEQFTEAEYEFDPSAGTEICPVGDFEPELDGSLVTVHMTDMNGETCDVQVALRCA